MFDSKFLGLNSRACLSTNKVTVIRHRSKSLLNLRLLNFLKFISSINRNNSKVVWYWERKLLISWREWWHRYWTVSSPFMALSFMNNSTDVSSNKGKWYFDLPFSPNFGSNPGECDKFHRLVSDGKHLTIASN